MKCENHVGYVTLSYKRKQDLSTCDELRASPQQTEGNSKNHESLRRLSCRCLLRLGIGTRSYAGRLEVG